MTTPTPSDLRKLQQQRKQQESTSEEELSSTSSKSVKPTTPQEKDSAKIVRSPKTQNKGVAQKRIRIYPSNLQQKFPTSPELLALRASMGDNPKPKKSDRRIGRTSKA